MLTFLVAKDWIEPPTPSPSTRRSTTELLGQIMHIDRTRTCTSDGYLPAGLSMEFNHKGHCLFYQTQLPLCVYLFRHECIEN